MDMVKVRKIKEVVQELEGIKRDLHVDSSSPLPSRDLIRARLSELDSCIRVLRDFVYAVAK